MQKDAKWFCVMWSTVPTVTLWITMFSLFEYADVKSQRGEGMEVVT